MDGRWLSVGEIAECLGISKDNVYAWIEKKGLPAHCIRHLWRSRRSEVDEWVHTGGAGDAQRSDG